MIKEKKLGPCLNGVVTIVSVGLNYIMGYYAITLRHKYLSRLNQTVRVNELSYLVNVIRETGRYGLAVTYRIVIVSSADLGIVRGAQNSHNASLKQFLNVRAACSGEVAEDRPVDVYLFSSLSSKLELCVCVCKMYWNL